MKRQVSGTSTFFRRTHENLCVADTVDRDSSQLECEHEGVTECKPEGVFTGEPPETLQLITQNPSHTSNNLQNGKLYEYVGVRRELSAAGISLNHSTQALACHTHNYRSGCRRSRLACG